MTLATNGVIADGTYARALARWGIQAEALNRSESNPPGLQNSDPTPMTFRSVFPGASLRHALFRGSRLGVPMVLTRRAG